MRRLDLAGFDAKFHADADPWRTFTDADEAAKRRAILQALGLGRRGRVWEPASGAGANSVALAPRALRLDATDGAAAAVALTAAALASEPRARAYRLALPEPPAHAVYDAIVVAEVLYYLSPRASARFARIVARTLRIGGRLVLAHHRHDFYDFSQHAVGIHDRFLSGSHKLWRPAQGAMTMRWIVRGYELLN